MKKVLFVIAFLLASTSVSYADCTQDEIKAKAEILGKQIQEYSQKNKDTFANIMKEYQADIQELAQTPEDYEKGCLFFDKWIEKTK